jgi:hypothetical protein
MKKALIASMLGIAASAMTSFGQGHISFDNYVTFGSTGAPIRLNTTGNPLVPTGGSVQLWYQLGTAADASATGTLLGTTTFGSGGTGAGYYNGGFLDVLNYVSGNISFTVVATSPGYAGKSSTLVLSTIATGPATPTELDIPSFNLDPVPEPSTFALAGLGSAALLIFRRRK